MTLGLVCDYCDAMNPLNATNCVRCGQSLGIVPARATKSPATLPGSTACSNCGTSVAPHFRFCPSCGKAMQPQPTAESGDRRPGKTMFFSAMQSPRPKLILIKGEE